MRSTASSSTSSFTARGPAQDRARIFFEQVAQSARNTARDLRAHDWRNDYERGRTWFTARRNDYASRWDNPGRDLAAFGAGAALAAGLVWFYGESGRRNRRRTADTIARFGTTAKERTGSARDAFETGRQEARRRFRGGNVSDEKLQARVRSKLGRLVANPHAIDVSAQSGRVTLSGPVLRQEVSRLVSRLEKVRGLGALENRLDIYDDPREAGLSGRAGEVVSEEPTTWTRGTRVTAAIAGGGFIAYALRNRDLLSAVLGIVGSGLLARALLPNRGAARRVDSASPLAVNKTIEINAPVDEVYRFWQNVENWPQFMSHLRSVRQIDERRSRWTAAGPLGIPVQWEAEVIDDQPNQRIAWRGVDGQVDTEGLVRFEDLGGRTRVSVAMRYVPPAGELGHAVAELFGADPKHAMDDDLLRVKSLLERGRARGTTGLPLAHERSFGETAQ